MNFNVIIIFIKFPLSTYYMYIATLKAITSMFILELSCLRRMTLKQN